MSALPAAFRPAPRPQGPARRPAPHLRLVGPPRRSRRYVAAILVVAAAGVFGSVSLDALAAEQAFASRELTGEVTELEQRYDELTAEVARLEAPERVTGVATRRLGMVAAQEPAFLVLDDDGGRASAVRTLRARTMSP